MRLKSTAKQVLMSLANMTPGGGLVKAALQPGQTIAIVGAGGGLGHLGVQFAKALGLKVIAIDARDEGLALAKECGADTVVDARLGKEKVVEEVKRVTSSQCADATLNVSDHETAGMRPRSQYSRSSHG
jgi:propanol-preferring alcohol dehydrogenase